MSHPVNTARCILGHHPNLSPAIVSIADLSLQAFVRTANEESEAWAQCAAFRRNILDKPWEITDQDQLRAKRRADGKEERRRARGEQKKKARLLEDAQKLRKRKELRQAHDNDGQVRREKGMVREDCHAERRMRPEAKARIRKT